MGASVVYFLQAEILNCIKIGYSNSEKRLESRILNIRCNCPDNLILVGTISRGSRKLERLLHEKFRKYHENGEWFRFELDVEVAIKTILAEQGKIINEDGDIDENWLKNYKFIPESSISKTEYHESIKGIHPFSKPSTH